MKKKKKLGTDLNKIDFKYSEAIKLSEANTSFPKFQFFLKTKMLSFIGNIQCCSPWSDNLTSFLRFIYQIPKSEYLYISC